MMAGIAYKGTQTPVPGLGIEDAGLSETTTYNYPNPFSGETTIRFILLTPEEVNVKVYDINDALVWQKNIPIAAAKAGINCLIWPGINDRGENISNGVYILEVAVQKKTVRKRIVLIN